MEFSAWDDFPVTDLTGSRWAGLDNPDAVHKMGTHTSIGLFDKGTPRSLR